MSAESEERAKNELLKKLQKDQQQVDLSNEFIRSTYADLYRKEGLKKAADEYEEKKKGLKGEIAHQEETREKVIQESRKNYKDYCSHKVNAVRENKELMQLIERVASWSSPHTILIESEMQQRLEKLSFKEGVDVNRLDSDNLSGEKMIKRPAGGLIGALCSAAILPWQLWDTKRHISAVIVFILWCAVMLGLIQINSVAFPFGWVAMALAAVVFVLFSLLWWKANSIICQNESVFIAFFQPKKYVEKYFNRTIEDYINNQTSPIDASISELNTQMEETTSEYNDLVSWIKQAGEEELFTVLGKDLDEKYMSLGQKIQKLRADLEENKQRQNKLQSEKKMINERMNLLARVRNEQIDSVLLNGDLHDKEIMQLARERDEANKKLCAIEEALRRPITDGNYNEGCLSRAIPIIREQDNHYIYIIHDNQPSIFTYKKEEYQQELFNELLTRISEGFLVENHHSILRFFIVDSEGGVLPYPRERFSNRLFQIDQDAKRLFKDLAKTSAAISGLEYGGGKMSEVNRQRLKMGSGVYQYSIAFLKGFPLEKVSDEEMIFFASSENMGFIPFIFMEEVAYEKLKQEARDRLKQWITKVEENKKVFDLQSYLKKGE